MRKLFLNTTNECQQLVAHTAEERWQFGLQKTVHQLNI